VALVTAAPDGSPANDDSLVLPSISATGRYVAFQSRATNLAAGPASGYQEIYERDTCIGAPAGCTPSTVRVTATYDGSAVNFNSLDSAISADGRYVAFDSEATNLLPNAGTCGSGCVFLRDTCIGASTGCTPNTILISVASDGSPAGGGNPSMTPDARYIAFNSSSANMVSGDSGGIGEAFVRNTCIGAVSGCVPENVLISAPATGTQDNATTGLPVSSSSGRYFAFQSWATNITAGETVVPGNFW
jgi:Tol biopolymer transport system component